ncbi:MAG: hypothetical protein ACOVNU_09165 [Candidatus Kapaibacteriota bacterium]
MDINSLHPFFTFITPKFVIMNQGANIYSYTASTNPYFVKCIAHKYGYTFEKTQPLGSVLQQLVAMEGEPVLMEIIENNPDKELFMDYFKKKYPTPIKEETKVDASKSVVDYMNFSGQQAMVVAENKRITSETSIMVLAGSVIIAFAIFSLNIKK